MHILDHLVGQNVIRCEIGKGVVSLILSQGVLAAYNPISGISPQDVTGTSITSVKHVANDRLSLAFSDGSVINVSLLDDDYSGPEAFAVMLADGTMIVE